MEGELTSTADDKFKYTKSKIIDAILDLLRDANFGNKVPGAKGDMVNLMRPIMVSISVRLNRSEKVRKEVYYDAQSAALIIFEVRKALREYRGTEIRSRIAKSYPAMIDETFWINLATKLNILEEYGTFSIEI